MTKLEHIPTAANSPYAKAIGTETKLHYIKIYSLLTLVIVVHALIPIQRAQIQLIAVCKFAIIVAAIAVVS